MFIQYFNITYSATVGTSTANSNFKQTHTFCSSLVCISILFSFLFRYYSIFSFMPYSPPWLILKQHFSVMILEAGFLHLSFTFLSVEKTFWKINYWHALYILNLIKQKASNVSFIKITAIHVNINWTEKPWLWNHRNFLENGNLSAMEPCIRRYGTQILVTPDLYLALERYCYDCKSLRVYRKQFYIKTQWQRFAKFSYAPVYVNTQQHLLLL